MKIPNSFIASSGGNSPKICPKTHPGDTLSSKMDKLFQLYISTKMQPNLFIQELKFLNKDFIKKYEGIINRQQGELSKIKLIKSLRKLAGGI